MEVLAGLLAFTVGLGLLVFPRSVAAEVGSRVGRDAGHREEVAVRALGALGMLVGFALLVG